MFLLVGLPALVHGQVGPVRVTINPLNPLVLINSQRQFSGGKAFFRNSVPAPAPGIVWQSSNSSVATFGLTPGLIQAGNTPGTTIVSAMSGPFRDSTTLTVASSLPPLSL